MTLDLTDDEKFALVQLLRRTIDEDRFPMSPRLVPLKAILAKMEPPNLGSPLPPSKVGLTKAFGDRDMFGSLEQPSLDRAITAAEGYGSCAVRFSMHA
jgi:hypothetical protein